MSSFMQDLFVVIPIQTIGFYNPMYRGIIRKINVVIPIQTIGFYNESSGTRRYVF